MLTDLPNKFELVRVGMFVCERHFPKRLLGHVTSINTRTKEVTIARTNLGRETIDAVIRYGSTGRFWL
jgi:hypothetical protein